MKILINTASTFEGGAIQVAISFIEECKKITENEYYIILGGEIASNIRIERFPDNFHFYVIPFRPATRILSLKSMDRFFKIIEAQTKPDIVFTTSGPAYWKPTVPHICGFNIAHFVYPESSYFKIISRKKRIRWCIDRCLKRYFFKRDGNYFVVQTDDINSRVRFWLKTENVFTVSNTCSSYYLKPESGLRKLPTRFPGEVRFLTFSTYRPHKNLTLIKDLLAFMPDNIKATIRFVLTIPKKDFERIFEVNLRKYLYNVGPVKVEDGPELYKECDASFLPTLLECFSAAYPESMAMGKPIVTSDLSFARSICKDAALYFNPLVPKDAADKIMLLINSPQLAKILIENGRKRLGEFGSATDRALKYIELCKKVILLSNNNIST